MEFIFWLAILIMSVVIHEVSHGTVAYILGDPTAKYMGRLTLNPIKHLDPIGSLIVPLFLLLVTRGQGPIFGWAKPVPYNPYNLKNQRYGPALVGFAGPAANLFIALIFGLMIRFSGDFGVDPQVAGRFIAIFTMIVLINLVLAIFNLVPIPPLDGSKILFAVLPPSMREVRLFLEQYGFFILLFFIFFLFELVIPIILVLFSFITGLSF